MSTYGGSIRKRCSSCKVVVRGNKRREGGKRRYIRCEKDRRHNAGQG